MKKKVSVSTTYYRSFLLLIVLPVLLIAAAGGMFLYRQLMEDAKENVQLRQENVSAVLEEEVREASMQLAHFLLSPETGVQDELKHLPQTVSKHNETEKRLEDVFSYYRHMNRKIEALHLYLEDGSAYELYADLADADQNVRETAGYLAAWEKPRQVCIGSAKSEVLLPVKNKGDILLTAWLHLPVKTGDESALDAACLYFESDAKKMIDDYNSEATAYRMFLFLDDGILAGDEETGRIAEQFLENPDGHFEKYDWCVQSHVHNTGLRVLTIADNRQLMTPYARALTTGLLVLAAVIALYIAFSVWFLRRILHPIEIVSEGMERLQKGDFSHRLEPEGHLELRQLMQSYNETAGRMQSLIEENRLREEEKYREEMKALQNEINPHFLLNTVNTIRFMADLAKFDSIRDMASDLMAILSCVLRNKNQNYTLADEAKLLKSYINIMEIRYSGGFTFHQSFSEECGKCRMPKLLLQPLVENALLHGLSEEDDGVVDLTAKIKDGMLLVSVSDNGTGMEKEMLERLLSGEGKKTGSSIGLANVRRRIELQYGPQYGLRAESAPGRGTRITAVLPAQPADREETECLKQ